MTETLSSRTFLLLTALVAPTLALAPAAAAGEGTSPWELPAATAPADTGSLPWAHRVAGVSLAQPGGALALAERGVGVQPQPEPPALDRIGALAAPGGGTVAFPDLDDSWWWRICGVPNPPPICWVIGPRALDFVFEAVRVPDLEDFAIVECILRPCL